MDMRQYKSVKPEPHWTTYHASAALRLTSKRVNNSGSKTPNGILDWPGTVLGRGWPGLAATPPRDSTLPLRNPHDLRLGAGASWLSSCLSG
jgi:hypothetical protein